ncbi:MAG: pyridoxamine 5'-phosphate oxidase [Lentisphaerae bacterium]|nr:pyridoxamine 5'-phosphate oxidase [Lentisphaerota bacterium]
MNEAQLPADPIELFSTWLEEASHQPLHNGVTVATVGPDGQPSARIVLLRGHDEHGFVFYTNYESRKARELEANPRAAMLCWWRELGRQIRIEGLISRVSRGESEAYFRSRPRGSCLGAWASTQSATILDRAELDRRLEEATAQFSDQEEVPCPPHWGGYRLVPAAIEFWEEQPDRLHDRLRYRKDEGRWIIERLAP